jgi:hypothetical protein
MRLLKLFVVSTFLYAMMGISSHSASLTPPCNYVGFEFVEQKKNVWVCAPKIHEVIEITGIEKSSYRGIDYRVLKFQRINFPPALFENIEGKIFINKVNLKDYTNAVVDKDGIVHAGQFIRSFD